MNNVQLIGRTTKDVELRYTPNGVAVANFSLAVNRPFKNKEGEQETDFIRCQCWRKVAENTAQYCGKGSQVAVTGRIQTSSFTNKEGNTVYTTEVISENVEFLQTKDVGSNESPQSDT